MSPQAPLSAHIVTAAIAEVCGALNVTTVTTKPKSSSAPDSLTHPLPSPTLPHTNDTNDGYRSVSKMYEDAFIAINDEAKTEVPESTNTC